MRLLITSLALLVLTGCKVPHADYVSADADTFLALEQPVLTAYPEDPMILLLMESWELRLISAGALSERVDER